MTEPRDESDEAAVGNPDRGPRCGECRLGLGVHEPADPLCFWHEKEGESDD